MSIAERFVGSSVKRVEDRRILTGRGTYVDDVKLPGMLHAVFLRSPMAHARLLSIDVSAARALRGVAAVYTGEAMETRGSVSSYDPDTEELTVYAATQGVGLTKMGMGMQLGHPMDKIRVIAGDIGGSFGLKFGAAREDVAAAAAARALKRPVKWIE